jgi:hypothetical protein
MIARKRSLSTSTRRWLSPKKMIMRAISILYVFGSLLMTSCSEDATVQLLKFTDIDVAGTSAHVTFVLRNDLDQPGYTIVVPKDREQAFDLAFESAAGKDCLRLVIDQSGCHYNSKHGHDVFVERTSPLTYSIYTSG